MGEKRHWLSGQTCYNGIDGWTDWLTDWVEGEGDWRDMEIENGDVCEAAVKSPGHGKFGGKTKNCLSLTHLKIQIYLCLFLQKSYQFCFRGFEKSCDGDFRQFFRPVFGFAARGLPLSSLLGQIMIERRVNGGECRQTVSATTRQTGAWFNRFNRFSTMKKSPFHYCNSIPDSIEQKRLWWKIFL